MESSQKASPKKKKKKISSQKESLPEETNEIKKWCATRLLRQLCGGAVQLGPSLSSYVGQIRLGLWN
ncbi:hypothetical protein F0562_014291 [Nyssa sinensis]|uniref:Uncharacterized protein n=1 Tax=Nyssa sinensis TaxID=561372 RepID=A0A5J4ZN08_9ASTE|nr:hypothetical protein F0562_014291 [Nyssa sinensis]